MTQRRRRTLPPVSPKTPQELKPLIAAMTEIMEVGEGVRGDPLDRKITFRDILDSGIGKLRDGMRPGDGALINPALPPAPDLSTPPSPAGFTAQGGFYGMINLSWQIPGQQYRIHAATNIYRSEVDNFANAEIIGREAGAFYTDYVRDDAFNPDDPTQLKGYYYWITFTSVHDVEGPPNDTAGTYAAPIADVGYVMELLTEQIDSSHLATELRQEIDSIIPIRDDLQGKLDVVEGRVDDEIIRLDGIRDFAYGRLDTVEQSIDQEIARLNQVEDNLLGPESVDGTVANRIADERDARLQALDGERDERIAAINFEADARADAIQAEAEARGEQIFNVQTEVEFERGLLASQLGVIAAAYQSKSATIYTLEEVRITDKEATATRINGLEVEVDNNKASLIEESTTRANETSALASQISVLSAKLDALPTFANGFEAGVEFDRWAVATGHTLTAETGDTFQGDQAALISSTEASVSTSSAPFAVSIALAAGTGDEFTGRRLRVGLAAKAVSGGSTQYAVGYATSNGWFSGWVFHTPTSLWSIQESLIDVPDTPGLDHYIVIWGDTSGSGGQVKIDRLLVEVANTDIPEITAQIENIQQALVDTEQTLTEDITNLQSFYGTQISDIQNTQTALSDSTQALAQDVQTLTATTGDLSADIQNESTVRATETEALAQDVSDLWAGIDDTQGQVTRETKALVDEDTFQGLIQNVIRANNAASSASVVSINEVMVEKDAIMAQSVKAIEGRVSEAEGAVTDIMQLNITPSSVLATRFSSIEGSVQDAEGAIKDIENLNIAADSVLVSRLSAIEGDIDEASGKITAIETLNIAPDSVLASTLNSLDGRVGSAEGNITAITDLTIGSNTVLASTLDSLGGRIGSAEGDISAIANLTIADDSVLASTINTISGQVDYAQGAIDKIESLTLSPNSALLSKLNSLEAGVGDASGEITNIKTLNLTNNDALLTELNRLSADLGDAAADIKNITNIELNDGSTIAQQFNTVDAALGDLSTNYSNIVNLSIDGTSALSQRFESLGTAEGFVYDLMDMNLNAVGDRTLVQRLIGVENETSKVQLKAASYSGALVQNGQFTTGDLTDWSGWSGIRVVEKDAGSSSNAVRTMPGKFAAWFDSADHATTHTLYSDHTPVVEGEDYTFQFKFAGGGSGINLDIWFYVYWYDLSGYIGANRVIVASTNTTAWNTSIVGKATAPSGAIEGRVGIQRRSGGNGTLLIADVRGNLVGEATGSLFTAKVEENGLIGGFGVFNDGEIVDAGFDVDRFWLGRTFENPEGQKVKPFIYDGDNDAIYMDTAFIRDASIQEGQLGTISIGKFFLDDGTPVTTVGGLIRAEAIDVDNLKVAEAATFTGVAQSGNFSSGNSGWRLNPNGTGEINFPISFANDSKRLAGSWGSTIVSRANNGNAAKSRVDSWTKTGTTKIDGGVITADEAWIVEGFIKSAAVDTLQIKGQAVTISSSGSAGGNLDVRNTSPYDVANYADAITFNFDPEGGAVIFQCGFSYRSEGGSSVEAIIRARLVVNGNVVKDFGIIDRSRDNYREWPEIYGNWASAYKHPGWSGSQQVKLQVFGDRAFPSYAFDRFLIALSTKR